MNRLTGWDGDRAYISGLKPFEMPVEEEGKIRAVVERLAAYEDIGLEPNTLFEVLDRVNEWYDAYNEDRLIVLPCKVGTAVYALDYNQHDGYSVEPRFFQLQDAARIGKTVFLSRQDAEKVLEEVER